MQIVTLIEFMTYENSVNIQMTDWATFVRQRHFSDTKITAVGQMSLSDKCPDRRHLSESGLISFSQAWRRPAATFQKLN